MDNPQAAKRSRDAQAKRLAKRAKSRQSIKAGRAKGHKPNAMRIKLETALHRIQALEKHVATLTKPHTFYDSREWLDLRYQALKRSNRQCGLCGASGILHVDHIKPRSTHPKLELDLDNLQVLCKDCNLGKSNKDATDWRKRPDSSS